MTTPKKVGFDLRSVVLTHFARAGKPPASRPIAREITDVHDFWEREPCGSRGLNFVDDEFFDTTEQHRWDLEGSLIAPFAQFPRYRGKRVLEIGVGTGCDFVQWSRCGARATGVDLTEAAVALTKRRLAREGFEADVRVADAESLPFADQSFDLVFSWGVIHHTPNPRRAIEEVRRVLRPGGEAKIMLYRRRSWVGLQLYLRWALLGGEIGKPLRSIIAEHLESPGTKAYEPDEIPELFSGFSRMTSTVKLTPWDLRGTRPDVRKHGRLKSWLSTVAYPRLIVRALGDRFGFYLLVHAVA